MKLKERARVVQTQSVLFKVYDPLTQTFVEVSKDERDQKLKQVKPIVKELSRASVANSKLFSEVNLAQFV